MNRTCKFLRPSPQPLFQQDNFTASFLLVEKRTLRDRDTEHLLQAKSLGTKLDPFPILFLALPPLMLHRIWSPASVSLQVELDNISFPRDPDTKRPDRQPERLSYIPPLLGSTGIDPLVLKPPLCGKPVLLPYLLQVDQGALPGAEHIMLQG
jgi:hypothetical protein